MDYFATLGVKNPQHFFIVVDTRAMFAKKATTPPRFISKLISSNATTLPNDLYKFFTEIHNYS